VIRSLVMTALHTYGVRRCLGFRYGYAGLNPASGFEPMELTHDAVDHVHEQGGTMLGSSRGPQDPAVMVDTLVRHRVDMLFTVGGDGTLRGASALAAEIARRGLPIAVIGVPKTIDNDLSWIARSFGFTTSVEEARDVLQGAHIEARGTLNGVGLVKLMGRHSGFIAAHACLANHDVDFCLVPEVPEELDGEDGFLRALEERLERRHHALIVVAEGFGQDLMTSTGEVLRDASGNVKLGDVGVFLRDRILEHFAGRGKGLSMKYIDPSYTIRSLPACAMDAEYCLGLGQQAVHAGMAGRTDMVVGLWNNYFTNVPMPLVTGQRRRIDPQGRVWLSVLDATGQRSYYRSESRTEPT
jgi:6-phosphofructokinase 1